MEKETSKKPKISNLVKSIDTNLNPCHIIKDIKRAPELPKLAVEQKRQADILHKKGEEVCAEGDKLWNDTTENMLKLARGYPKLLSEICESYQKKYTELYNKSFEDNRRYQEEFEKLFKEGRLGQSAGRVFDARENAIEELINDSKYSRSRLSKKFELIEQEYEIEIVKSAEEQVRKMRELERKLEEATNLRSDGREKMREARDLIRDSNRSRFQAVKLWFSIAEGGMAGGVWYCGIKLVESAAHVARNSTIGIETTLISVVLALESMAVIRNRLKDAEK